MIAFLFKIIAQPLAQNVASYLKIDKTKMQLFFDVCMLHYHVCMRAGCASRGSWLPKSSFLPCGIENGQFHVLQYSDIYQCLCKRENDGCVRVLLRNGVKMEVK